MDDKEKFGGADFGLLDVDGKVRLVFNLGRRGFEGRLAYGSLHSSMSSHKEVLEIEVCSSAVV